MRMNSLIQLPRLIVNGLGHVFDGDELRGVLFGTNPQAAAKLNPIYRLMLRAARMTQMLRSVKLLRFMSRIWMPIANEVVVIGGGLVGLDAPNPHSYISRHEFPCRPWASAWTMDVCAARLELC